jgi:hypothetical protein
MINIVIFIYHHLQVNNMATYNEKILNTLAKAEKTEVNGEKVRVSYGGESQVFGLRPVAYVLGVADGNVGEMAVRMLDLNAKKTPYII